jgi:hypothetical protein
VEILVKERIYVRKSCHRLQTMLSSKGNFYFYREEKARGRKKGSSYVDDLLSYTLHLPLAHDKMM